MSAMRWAGVVRPGHGVASGVSVGSPHNPYPSGSIAMQLPHFLSLGLDLSAFFLGTVNLDIAPQRWRLEHADHCFRSLRWTDLHPPETFSFVAVQALWEAQWHTGWIYFPHPETKAAHFQDSTVMELILPKLQSLRVGAPLQLRCAGNPISLVA